ncbi:MAG: ATP-binding protein [Balneolaceae bacterium]
MEASLHIENAEDLYQNAPCGYLSIHPDGSIIEVNKTLLSWLNFKREELVDNKYFQEILGKGGEIYFETHLKPMLQIEGEISEINLELKGKGRIQIPVLINAKKVHQNTGDQPIYRFSVLDMSQRKLYENELIKERKNAEEAMTKLSQINVELERFTHRTSHDLQAPLKTISGIISLIEAKNLIQPNSKIEELFSLITKNATRMRMMIDDLLEYSKVDGESITFESVSLQDVCNEAIELLHESVQKYNVSFCVAELPEVKGVKIQLLNLFLNLFSNAIKYSSDNVDPIISVSGKKSGNVFKIMVKDNGMGFDQKYSDKIFDFMERLHTQDKIAGTGIGLSTCKLIVENHGGKIWAESTLGKGSTFYFTLPKVPD